MGYGRYTSSAWVSHSTTRGYDSATTADSLLTATTVDEKMNPLNITVREARDSAMNPKSLPIILALDTTGSMGGVILQVIKKFHMILEELIEKKAVEDPTIMTMFFDDVIYEKNALQVSQFESDVEAAKQLDAMMITRNGGGNSSESYHLPLYMAAFKTRTDSMQKRKKRGYLFTVGDEEMPPPLTPEQIKHVFGNDESVTEPLSYMDLFAAAQRDYHVFHVVVMQGNHASYKGVDAMKKVWAPIGQSLITLDDLNSLPEVIVSTIRICEGEDADAVAKSWSGTTAVTVKNATGHLAKGADSSAADSAGPVEL